VTPQGYRSHFRAGTGAHEHLNVKEEDDVVSA
jgi:hypothetical protein